MSSILKRSVLLAIALSAIATSPHAKPKAGPRIAPYGTWVSSFQSTRADDSGARFSDIRVQAGRVYWSESRPNQNGRSTITELTGKGLQDLTPTADARTRVHEYGGTCYVVGPGGVVYYSQFSDQRLYAQAPGAAPRPLTPPGYRYADCAVGNAVAPLVCVREDHTGEGEAKNTIVAIDPDEAGPGKILFDDSDFVAYPRVSRDGKRLAWISWRHPNMPWDGTTLRVADLTAKGLSRSEVVAGGSSESIMDPQWDADGALYFLSDRTDWSNLYVWRGGRTRPVYPHASEFATPLHYVGAANYALTGDGRAFAVHATDAVDTLTVIDLKRGMGRDLKLPFVNIDSIQMAGPDRVVFVASWRTKPQELVELNVRTCAWRSLHSAAGKDPAPNLISGARAMTFKGAKGREAHAFFYAPVNPAYRAPAGEKPPLIVQIHGGPTGQTYQAYDLAIQYWTSRGFALLDVNFSGSTGYGRAYRERLNGQWGVLDFEDMLKATDHVVALGLVDPNRLLIHGASNGGYITLRALTTSKRFRAGTDYYGPSEMETLARSTHKFQSRYPTTMLGSLPLHRADWRERSPISRIDQLSAPLLIFQGLDDRVVPPDQSRAMVEAAKAKGLAIGYMEFEGEGHGFRRAETNARAKEAELSFYGQVLGFTPPGIKTPVHIENLSSRAGAK
jgi:dipeptidyl aminopeptidase/acylaminoacyl peptidase